MNKKFRITAMLIAIIIATVVFVQAPNSKQYTPEDEETYKYPM